MDGLHFLHIVPINGMVIGTVLSFLVTVFCVVTTYNAEHLIYSSSDCWNKTNNTLHFKNFDPQIIVPPFYDKQAVLDIENIINLRFIMVLYISLLIVSLTYYKYKLY